MSSAKADATPTATRKRRLRSWTGATAAGDGDESTAAASASVLSAAQSSSAAQQRKKVRRQQLLAAAFGDQPRPPRWRDFPTAQRCFSDGLALAFSFLTLFELIPAARTCRSWRDAALKANVAGAELHNVVLGESAEERLVGSARLRSLASSPFRRHVHKLTHDDDGDYDSHMQGIFSPSEWSLTDLAMLQHLPQLRRISGVRVELASARPVSDLALRFPPLLESADLSLSFDGILDGSDESWNTAPLQRLVLQALRPCHSLTELSITVHPWIALCLDGLLELSSLQILMLDIEHADRHEIIESTFTEDHMRIVKQMPNLRDLSLRECDELDGNDEDDPFGTRWLRWLCPMHRLQQLEELSLGQHHLQLEHMQLLQQLPALTTLEPLGICETALPLLPAFAARLQSLDLAFTLWNDEEDIDPELVDLGSGFARGPLILPHLTPCSALAHLLLSACIFTEAEATALCQALPKLCVLVLKEVGWPSIEPLRHLPLLESLTLRPAKNYPLHIEAAHFRPLKQLCDLSLMDVRPLSDAAMSVIDALRPPSALLPGLVYFHFEQQDDS